MGLFDFLKSSSKATQNAPQVAAELRKTVEGMGIGIKDFNVGFADGVATLSGIAATQKDLEIARLTVGNYEGVHKVNDDALTVAPDASPMKSGRMYTVKSGDTLSKIAKDQLGDPNKYAQLFEANQPMLKDPNKIYPGQVLRVPDLAA